MSPDELYPFDEFTNFLDLIGMPPEWAPVGFEIASDSAEDSSRILNHAESDTLVEDTTREDSPFQAWLPSVPPNEQSINSFNELAHHPRPDKPTPLRVDVNDRICIMTKLTAYHSTIPNFSLPSRHTLSRYLLAFFEGFHKHMLFLHIPTFRLTDHSPELILAIMAAGAQYRFEYQNAARFFHASKAIVSQCLQADMQMPEASLVDNGLLPMNTASSVVDETETIRCLLILMGFAAWQDTTMLRDAFQLRNLLIQTLRRAGLEDTALGSSPETLGWARWVQQEECRRAKLAAFAFVDMYSIAYNHYPSIRNHEVKLLLPCQTKIWNAPNAAEWLASIKAAGQEQCTYHGALSQLLQGSNTSALLSPMPSPLGNYYLLHGLIQRIHIIRELALDLGNQSSDLPEDELNRLERALRSWTTMWQQAPESSIDPANENGPIPFTSSSMLGLAYVRLTLNLGPFRHLETRDPSSIAAALAQSPPVKRSGRMISALIYAIHSFSIPVRLGIDYVARSQAFFWSVRHAISSFECVVLLSKWLFALEVASEPRLSANEKRVLRWATQVVEEAYDSMDLYEDTRVPRRTPGDLGLGVLEIWSRFFQHNSQWRFINTLGEALAKYGAHLKSLLRARSS
ncbi:fungal-specific transcription factor domain-containing protein [Aspergillus karnatakaensis]|uniref:transcription factor domain-containing protein n=1 Tax=Aspergillus karnatakaensis TaxID=1810916 RepID=UPI003CCDD3D0